MKKKIKIKLRDLTEEQYKEWQKENCEYDCESIEDCIFTCTNCALGLSSCWIYHKEMYSDKFLDQELEIEVDESFKLTEDEKVILRNIDKKWKYIARNKDNDLFLFDEKPNKVGKKSWYGPFYETFFVFNRLFKFIKCEDEEPHLIEDLLKEN